MNLNLNWFVGFPEQNLYYLWYLRGSEISFRPPFHLYYPYSDCSSRSYVRRGCQFFLLGILPSSLYLPLWGGVWVFFSGNRINPLPGATFPLAQKNRVSARRQLSVPRRAVTLLLKKVWLKLFQFGVNVAKIISFEIIYSSLMFQTPDWLLKLELW